MKGRNMYRALRRSAQEPRMQNPLFPRTPRRALSLVLRAALCAAVVGGPLVFFSAPFMQYSDVRVTGLTTLSADEVTATTNTFLARHRWFVIPGRHMTLLRAEALKAMLQTTYAFTNVTLQREGRTLVVTATERVTEVAWTQNGTTFFIDLLGVAVREATPEALAMLSARRSRAATIPTAPGMQPTMPIIDVSKGDSITQGMHVISDEHLAHMLALDMALRERNIVPITYTLDEQNTPWLTMTPTEGPELLFAITTAPQEAIARYDAFVSERGDELPNFAYIDLRFGNHLYIKER